jgi:hypothetical protein
MAGAAKAILGPDGQILTQQYAVSQVVAEASARGYAAEIVTRDDGQIEVNLDNFQE